MKDRGQKDEDKQEEERKIACNLEAEERRAPEYQSCRARKSSPRRLVMDKPGGEKATSVRTPKRSSLILWLSESL